MATLTEPSSVAAAIPSSRAPQGGSESAQKRDEAARLRDESATLRDEVAVLRDEVDDLRDNEIDLRDPAAEQRDQAVMAEESSQEIVTDDHARSRADAVTAREDAASDRRDAEQDRLLAAKERMAAGLDRDASAGDRHHSEKDRDGSATDRGEATEEIDAASLDELTDTYMRGPGMAELERDRSRADRTGEPMTLVVVDVGDLKGANDRAGHPAGDRLLRQVADALRAYTRPHDVIVRYGGDEFVCALVGLQRDEAAERLAAVNVALAETSEPASITVGLAQLEAGESLSSLIERDDEALYDQRRQR